MFKLFELDESQAKASMKRNPRYHELTRGIDNNQIISSLDIDSLQKNNIKPSLLQKIFSFESKDPLPAHS